VLAQKLALVHYRSGVRALAGTEDGASLKVVVRALRNTRESGFDVKSIIADDRVLTSFHVVEDSRFVEIKRFDRRAQGW